MGLGLSFAPGPGHRVASAGWVWPAGRTAGGPGAPVSRLPPAAGVSVSGEMAPAVSWTTARKDARLVEGSAGLSQRKDLRRGRSEEDAPREHFNMPSLPQSAIAVMNETTSGQIAPALEFTLKCSVCRSELTDSALNHGLCPVCGSHKIHQVKQLPAESR